jgi:predicted PurR-regulated permease PerM
MLASARAVEPVTTLPRCGVRISERAAVSDDRSALRPEPVTRLVRFTPGAALVVTVAVFAAFIVRNIFVAAHQIIGWVVACAIVALLVDPVVNLVQRVLPRVLSVIAVVIAMLALVGAIAFGITTELRSSIDDLEEAAPEAAKGLEERYDWAEEIDVTTRVDDFVTQLDESVRQETVDRTLGRVPTLFVTGVLMLFLLAYGRRYILGALGLFDDLERRQLARRVVFRAGRRGRDYLLASLVHAVTTGLIFGAVCRLLDLPAPLSLGFAVGLLTLIPLIGTLVGGIPALLLAFGSSTWREGAIVLAVLVALQVVEVLVVRPQIDSRSVRLGPTVAIIVALLAFDLYGFGAALFGVALAVLALAGLDAYGEERDDELVGDEA